MTPKKENIEEYKALEASRQRDSMEAMIKAHLKENCPKYDEAHFEGCMRYLVTCAREILANGKTGQFYGDERGRIHDKMTPNSTCQLCLEAYRAKFLRRLKKVMKEVA